MPVTTGVIADDFTGATDIASFMAEQGWRVALLPGMPDAAQPWNEEVDAIVISLKAVLCRLTGPSINHYAAGNGYTTPQVPSRFTLNIAPPLILPLPATSVRSAMR